jgi:type IV secretory pathway component VirB8
MAKSVPKQTLPPPAEDNGLRDKIGRYPAHVHVPALESRRYLWTSRAYAIALYVSLALSVIIAAMIFVFLPLKSVAPILLTFPKDGQAAVLMQPALVQKNGLDLLAEKMVGEYVKLREEIIPDNPDMMAQYQKFIAARSNVAQSTLYQQEITNRLQEFATRRFTRKVDVENIKPLGHSYVVDYTTSDFDVGGNLVQKLLYQAIVTTVWQAEIAVPDADRVNPLGFAVTGYEPRIKTILLGQNRP